MSIISRPPQAADPQSYEVEIAETGDDALDRALRDGSRLEALRETAPVGPFALVARAKQDAARLETVLHSFGFYQGRATITIDGHPLDDPTLPDKLAAIPADRSVTVAVGIEQGPRFHLRQISIEGDAPPWAQQKLGLTSGQPAIAADVLGGRTRLLEALHEDGYALAKVDAPVAFKDDAAHALDISYKVDAGPRVDIGDIAITGLDEVSESYVRRRLLLNSGELYRPSRIEEARRDLATVGMFSGVTVRVADHLQPDGRIGLTFDMQERPEHTVGVTGAYSTDLGGTFRTTWSHRNLFGNAERLDLFAGVNGLGGTAVEGLGYNVGAQLTKPDFRRRDQSIEFEVGAFKQNLDAYSQTAAIAGTSLHRKLSRRWTVSIGLSAQQEEITQQGVARDYTLLGIPLVARYDGTGITDPLQDPTQGVRSTLTAIPTRSFGASSSIFAILQASSSIYFDIGELLAAERGRSVLALRALIGTVEGASQFDLPPDQRFYGGGSGTVRGFRYQSIGPLFPDGKPIGGTAIDAATVEFRQRLFGDFGAVAFVDAGQVSDDAPFTGTVRIGAGAGLRYYTPIGPVRLDFAVPINKPPDGDAFEIYIGLGQAF